MKHAAAVLVLALSLAPSRAGANGRFPFASQLVVAPNDAAHIVVRTTYGIIQSFDAGKTWKWVCETSVGYGGTLDPAIGVSGDGRLLVGLFTAGIASSPDRGCSFTSDAPPFTGMFVNDLTVDPSNPKRVVALAVRGSLGGAFTVLVGESTDGGATFTQLGDKLPETFDPETIEIAPSRVERLYASGIRLTPKDGGFTRTGWLYRSDDRGKSWKEIEIDLRGGLAPYVSAVDPVDANKIYVRLSADEKTGAPFTDRLLVSNDGGESFAEIATTVGNMLGFALSPDGKKFAFGGPKDGVLVGSTTDFKSARVSTVGPRCLNWSAAGLYACAAEFPDNFTIGLSVDDGKTFSRLYKLAALSPLECPSGTSTRTLCPREWPAIRDSLGIVAPDAGPSDGGAEAEVAPSAGGCDACTLGRASGLPALASLVALLTASFVRHRKRRGPEKSAPS